MKEKTKGNKKILEILIFILIMAFYDAIAIFLINNGIRQFEILIVLIVFAAIINTLGLLFIVLIIKNKKGKMKIVSEDEKTVSEEQEETLGTSEATNEDEEDTLEAAPLLNPEDEVEEVEIDIPEEDDQDDDEDEEEIEVRDDLDIISSAYDNFTKYGEEHGLLLDKKETRKIFAALAMTRMLFVKLSNPDKEELFIKTLANYFNQKPICYTMDENVKTLANVLVKDKQNTEFMKGLVEASANEKDVRFVFVKNNDLSRFDTVFGPIMANIKSPKKFRVLNLTDIIDENSGVNPNFRLPNNVYYINIISSETELLELSAETLRYTYLLNIKFKDDINEEVPTPKKTRKKKAVVEESTEIALEEKNEEPVILEENTANPEINTEENPTVENVDSEDELASEEAVNEVEEVFDNDVFTYPELLSFNRRIKSRYFMKEETWKKIDNIENFINRRKPFAIGNKLTLELEDYSSAILAEGGDENEVLDDMVAYKLTPIVFKICKKSVLKSEDQYITTIDRTFGEDALKKTSDIVRLYSSQLGGE